jgi:hypothetical protein
MFAGDWHGNLGFASAVIARARKDNCDRVVQLGDFGFWPNGDKYLIGLQKSCELWDVDLYMIHGNHDEPDRWLNYGTANDEGFREVTAYTWDGDLVDLDRLHYIPDGHRWEWDRLQIGGVGGAASIDRDYRLMLADNGHGTTWWPKEVVTPEAVELVCNPHYSTGEPRRLDILVTHEGPSWTGAHYDKGHGGSTFIPIYDLARGNMCRALVDTAAKATRPWLHLHGHYHSRAIGYAPWHSPDDGDGRLGTGVVITLDADVNGSIVNNIHIIDTETDVPPMVSAFGEVDE